jgi:superfamily II DNA or RNA helicase/HKD family nuclease
MREGLYDSLLTARLAKALQALGDVTAQTHALDEQDAPARLARFLGDEVRRLLGDLHGDERVAKQAALVNELLAWLKDRIETEGADTVASPAQVLLAIHRTPEPPPRPLTPIGTSTLLIRPGKPDLGHELAAEFASADRVDALVSFVTWSGFRRLRRTLEEHARVGRRLRLLTTTYTGATEAAAIREIAKLTGAEVRVSFDGRRSRIHAKAWLFHRETGFSSVWVGSANLSASALAGGLEWTMKASEADLRHVVEMFRGSFDSLWEDPEFEPIDPANEEQQERLESALQAARGGLATQQAPALLFDLRPYPFQEEILEQLAEERDGRGHYRNLVVAATGTGKTMLAGFDYARQRPERPTLLFLAHREELLTQARTAFRHILRDGSFGELLTGAVKPKSATHLFATIQSFHNSDLADRLGADYWKYVVIDEAHHAPADSYQAVLARLKPTILLGLTATPERTDNQSLLPDFDGAIAAEMRLWHALEKQLVVPFEYYGVADETDFSAIEWRRGGYDAKKLDVLLTGNHRRAELIAEQFRKYRGAWRQARALAFCTSVRHAEFMSRKFNDYNIPSAVVYGDTPDAERKSATTRLRDREVNVLFTCDLFNEGIDLPFVDTLLFLRPTSSATVFLQQMGRGLRLSPDKPSCLILDFVGQHRREFRFDDVLSAVTGTPRGHLAKEVEAEFPTLPAGCVIQLDRVAKERILESLHRTLRGGEQRLAAELRAAGPMTIAAFLEHTGRSLEQIHEGGGMTHLRRVAGQLPPADDRALNRRFGRLLHIDDPARLAVLRNPRGAAPLEQLMLGYQLFHETTDLFEPAAWLDRLNLDLLTELAELADALSPHAHAVESPRIVPEWPLHFHRRYDRREVQTASGDMTPHRKRNHREGVLRLSDLKTELFFVTLDKSEGSFSPTTSYRDYAISRDHFHWETQNSAAEDTPTGRRYIQQLENAWRFLLFVRETPGDAFVALGPVRYVSHTGERPMGITWKLNVPMPAALFEKFAALLAA